MRVLAIFFLILLEASADSFIGNMYADFKDLNLSRAQQLKIKAIIKDQHEFLKEWYIKAKDNNDKIMQSFSTSTLKKHSTDLVDNINLQTARLVAEQDFLIALYEVLDSNQREKFGQKIKQREKAEEKRLFGNKMEEK